ncbi:MAG: RNA polymerase sigma factor [Pseudomonadota bacterium]
MCQVSQRDDDQANAIDKALFQQIAENRNTAAMQNFYERYRSRLIPFLSRMTSDHAVLEEVYNDVMLTVWNKADQFQGNSKVSSWVFSIAYRMCLKILKKQTFRQRVLDSFSLFRENEEEAVGFEDADNEEHEKLRIAIKQLSAKHRMVVELSYFQGYSTEQIGEIADCPVNTVKTRLHHARQKIHAYMSMEK